MTNPLAEDPSGVRGPEGTDAIRQALQLLGALRRHGALIALVTAAALVLAAGWTLRQPKIYRATATVLINNRPPATLDKVGDVVTPEYYGEAERFVNAQLALLASREMAARVATALGMSDKGALVGRLQVVIDRSSQMASLSVEDPDPATAQKLANAFKNEYVRFAIADRSNISLESASFLDDQWKKLRAQLEADEKALFEFQRTHELPGSNFEESHKILSSHLSTLHAQYTNARTAGIHLASELSEIEAARKDPNLLRALVLTDAGSRWTDLRGQHVMLTEQLSQLESRYGARHPKLVETREALAAVDRELDREVEATVGTLEAKRRANASEQAQLKAVIEAETRRAVDLREGELTYNTLKRRRDEDQAAYDLVAHRLKETQLQAADHQTYVRPIDDALLPQVPVRPRLSENLLVAFGLGLMVGIGLALLLDFIDDTVRLPSDAERSLEQPLLGVIMSIPSTVPQGSDEQAIEIARAEHIVKFPRSKIAEQCHVASTNLYSLFLSAPPKSIMVTSATVDDGKTLVSVNLAATVAARGKKVLLIDADLRRGRLHRLFQLPRGGGLFELVTQRISAAEAIRGTFIPSVDVITTGEVPEKVTPIRILELPELPRLFGELQTRYDLVVVDSAPVNLVADAQIIGTLVDGTVGVMRAGKTSRRLARSVAQQLALARVNLIGWILNDISESALKSGYYHKYGYGYGRYGYDGYYGAEPPQSAG